MGLISIHSDEFADIVTAYLLDMLRDEENLPANADFRKLVKIMKDKGVKPHLYNSFITMGSTTRVNYKRIKQSLLDDDKDSKILITKGTTDYIKEDQDFDRELCKQVFRKIKEVRFKHPSKVLTEERIDKIIDYCVQQKKKKEENNG